MRAMLITTLWVTGGCTPHEPTPASHSEAEPRPVAMNLGLLYWAPDEHVLEGSYPLVFGAYVVALETSPAPDPDLRGPTITEATLRLERVIRQIDPPSAKEPPPRLEPGELVRTDGAEGLALGDRVLVFASDYDGGYGIVPKVGTRTPIGIVVQEWSDPIVGATERWLDGKTDWSTEAELWRPYGQAIAECMRESALNAHDDLDGLDGLDGLAAARCRHGLAR